MTAAMCATFLLTGTGVAAQAHDGSTVPEVWFPVQTPVDSFVDSWGAPRSGGRGHEGTDVMAPQMQGVYASQDGEIIKAKGEDCSPGTVCSSFYLAVAGDDGRGYFYVHLNNDTPGRPDGCDQTAGYDGAFAPRLVEELEARGTLRGVRVERGQLIGFIGSSGNAACGSDQLHYEIWNDHDWGQTGKQNPYPALRQAFDDGRTWGPEGPAPDAGPILRDAGDNRRLTAIALSAAAFETSDVVVLAPDDSPTEALVAAPLAATLSAPVLLTNDAGDGLAALGDEIDRLGTTRLVVVGDERAVPDELIEQLLERAAIDPEQVTRIQGPDPAALSVAVANEVVARTDQAGLPLLAVGEHDVAGRDWPDAMSAGPLASRTGRPILLTPSDTLAPEIADYLIDHGVETIDIVGGPEAIAATVQEAIEDMGVSTSRIAGATRYETSLELADLLLAQQGTMPTTTHVATGTNYPDALAAATSVVARNSVLILTNGTSGSPAAVRDWLRDRADTIDEIHVVGGPEAISDAIADEVGSFAAWPTR